WPEALFIDSRWANPARAALRVLRLKLRILLTRAFGGAIVWTVHNRAPHEPPGEYQRYARFMDWFQRRVSLAIAMDDAQLPDLASRFPSTRQWRTIPHPAYNLPEPVPLSPEFAVEGARRLAVMFGKMRHYKGAPQAMTAFVEAASGGDRLIVAGRARDRDMSKRLAAIAAASGGAAVYVDRAITDRELAALLSAADVAVFNFSAILNS